jgi:type I restriction enzyme R subunit
VTVTTAHWTSKPDPSLTKKEEQEVRKLAQDLLSTLKREKLVLDWRKRQQSTAAVWVAIQDQLDRLPRTYTPELYTKKCNVVYQHVYDSYYGAGGSVYG